MDRTIGSERSLEALHRMAAEAEPLDDTPREFIARVVRAIAELAGARQVALFIRDEGRLELVPPAFGFAESNFEDVAGPGAVTIPWLAGRRRLGILVAAGSKRPGGFNAEDIRVLETAAVPAALLWQQRELAGQLSESRGEETERMRALATRMKELEEMKGHILNLAAHELRGPIAVIHGYLSMVSDSSLDADGLRRILPILLGKVAQMNVQVTQMLEAARLEEGRLELATERVDLGQVVREAIEVAGLLAPPGINLLFERASDEVLVRADSARVGTIVGNLVDNAIKYSPGGGLVKCSLGVDDGMATVRVEDSGLGIAAADMGRLFSRFGRILTADNSHIGGTGLGLYLSLELARMQGGDIVVTSMAGFGSVFTLLLPLWEPVRDDD